MDGQTILQWFAPLVCAIFACALLAIGLTRREFVAARIYALAYGFGTIAAVSELSFVQSEVWSLSRVVGEQFYIASTFTCAVAAFREWRGSVPWKVLAPVGLACLAIGPSLWYYGVAFEHRTLATAANNAALLLCGAAVIVSRARSFLDWQIVGCTSALAVAIVANGYLFGGPALTAETYSKSAYLGFLSLSISVGALAIALSLLCRYLQAMQRSLIDLAVRDALTGALNRRGFEDHARSRTGDFALIVADIDHFKRTNDEHGHQVGDAVIQAMAARLSANLMPGAEVGRVGGEEFAIALPVSDRRVARLAAEMARASVSAEPVRTDVGEIELRASFGVAVGDDYDDTFRRADTALYEAKAAGRDRVCMNERRGSEGALRAVGT